MPLRAAFARVASAWLVLLSLLAGSMGGTAFAEPPPDWEPEPQEPAFEPPANGFDWNVPDRFAQKPDGRFEWKWNQATQSYDDWHVHPDSWPMNIYGCQTEADLVASINRQPTVNTYVFESAHGAKVEGRNCSIQVSFPEEANYDVRWTMKSPQGAVLGKWSQTVWIKDYLIASMGDSYGSGEGAPEYNRPSGAKWGRWVDDRCHRSSFAGAPQAARMIEAADPKTSVTFLGFACSGATISREYFEHSDAFPENKHDPWAPGDPALSNGSGILGPARGVQPPTDDNADKIPSQLQQLVNTLRTGNRPPEATRDVDALIISAGGNDASFAPLASACVVWDDCRHPNNKAFTGPNGTKVNLETRIAHDLSQLPGRYAQLEAGLRGLEGEGVRIGSKLVTEYPDPGTQMVNGKVQECDYILDDIMITMELSGVTFLRPHGSELDFARNVFLPAVNQHLRQAAATHGWHYVDGINAGFLGHGYCVGARGFENNDRYIQTAILSTYQQGPYQLGGEQETKGLLHPNKLGYQVYKDRIHTYLKPQIAQRGPDGGRHHRFDTTPPTVTGTTAPAAGANGWHTGDVEVRMSATAAGGRSVARIEHKLSGDEIYGSTPGSYATRTLTGEGTWVVSYRAVDSEDNRSEALTLPVKIDRTAPARPTLNLGGATDGTWSRTPVTVTATSTDGGPSGLDRLEQRVGEGPWTPMGGGTTTITTEGGTALQVRAVDVAGNVSEVATATLRIDTNAPQVACGTADGRWHPGNVSVGCTATDATSGLAEGDRAFALTTSVDEGTETADAVTGSREVCDAAGNCATASAIGGNKVDRRAPQVTVILPAGPHTLGDVVRPTYHCADAGSGIASCEGPVASGEPMDTATPGTNSFEVVAVDAVGNRTTRTVTYQVHWPFGGLTGSVSAPPKINQVNGGAAVPVQFSLGGDRGMGILAEGSPTSRQISCDPSAPQDTVEQTIDTAGPALTYDAASGNYLLRWRTEGTWNGTCRQLTVELKDGSQHTALFRFGK